MQLLEKVSPQWRVLIERLLLEEIRDNIPFEIECQELFLEATCIYWGSKYATYKIEKEPSSKAIIFCVFPSFIVEVAVSTEQLFYECDNEHADQVVDWLNQQFAASWEEIPGILNPDHDSFMFWRRFDEFHCGLLVRKRAKIPPVDESKAIVKDQLMCLSSHNLPFEVDEDNFIDIVIRFFLVIDFEKLFEMMDENVYEFLSQPVKQ